MIAQIESTLRRWRRYFSRSEWLARLLKLSFHQGDPDERGLVLIQIDGLAHEQLQKAMANGKMPFIKRLLEREHYHLEHLYSGVPATTPAVQAEIFYGVKTAVPAFGFFSGDTGQMMRMYEPYAADCVERKLAATGHRPLLKDGSCYVSVFRAGSDAKEAHFCSSSRGWGPALSEAGWLSIVLMILASLWGLIRTIGLLLVELVLSLVDFFRGLVQGQDFIRELMFIPTRLAITILTRELSTLGVKIDIARGVPIIFINLLGYDEQAHRRGPSSKFAHWTLKGIDDTVARIWRAAQRSFRRHYDVWIYSDHGQEDSQSYEAIHGRPLAEAVSSALSSLNPESETLSSAGQRGVQLQRVRLFGGQWIQKLFPVDEPEVGKPGSPLALSAMGPLGLLYNLELHGRSQVEVARFLVKKTGVPLVLYRSKLVSNSGLLKSTGVSAEASLKAFGWWRDTPVELPRDADKVLGKAHPFAAEAAVDLVNLCHHPDAGDFVFCGWSAGSQSVSFAIESGSHGGSGPNETHAFALMPQDIPAPNRQRGHWRPMDIRQAALDFLYGKPKITSVSANYTTRKIRVMTYNVHICRGIDGKLSPRRIARVIARYAPDIVALQEVDVQRQRTGGVDQVVQISELLAMEFHFQPAIHLEEERYGDAILSRLPITLIKKDILPGPAPQSRQFGHAEPRGALWVEVQCNGAKLQILNTHLGLNKAERLRQVDALVSTDWLCNERCQQPRILLGDFNAMPGSAEYRRLRRHLLDAQLQLPQHQPQGTFFSRLPKTRIDHVFIDGGFKVIGVQVPRNELTRMASDHLPLVVDLEVPATDSPQPGENSQF